MAMRRGQPAVRMVEVRMSQKTGARSTRRPVERLRMAPMMRAGRRRREAWMAERD